MGNVIKSELFKLRKDRSFRTLTWLLIAVSVLYPLLMVVDDGPTLVNVEEFYMYNIIGGNNYIVKLVPCILAGFFISSEFSIGTMKSMVASGNSRIRIYFAKLIVYAIGAIVISLILPLVLTGASALYFGFSHLPELSYYLETVGCIALYAAAFASIMAIFSTIFTDSGRTIGFLLLFFLLFDSILYILSNKISFFEPIFNYSVFKLLLDIVNIHSMDGGEVFTLVLVPIVTFIVFGVIGSLIFKKKEIK
ncbi:ABC transporter permease [Bacillaceae bacterium C204]|uniref:ABC transporter permease n=1 Tax=Neobacillus sp. 204 TaxID=3383351 RepID=UPI00397E62A3